MSDLPQPKSYEQLLSDALSSYASAVGVNDLNTLSVMTSFFEVSSLATARASGDIFQILKDFSLSRATGPAIKKLGTEYGVAPITSKVSTGYVNFIDQSFQKVSTKVYAGLNPPIPGSTLIYISDASLFPSTGSIYIGRGTVNIEGPIAYTSPTQIGSYWSISLVTPTTKFHNTSESVILFNGGVRSIPVNTVVYAPGTGATSDVQFKTTQVATILDGETTVTNVPVTAMVPGASGNVQSGGISKISGSIPGISKSSVTNPLAFSTGADTETDESYRIRIQAKLASTGLGTISAIESALQGVQDPNSSATIVSTDVLNNSSKTIVYVDDGSGYEATTSGSSIESILDSALSGERFFQLQAGGKQTSIAKAFLTSVNSAPFTLSGGEVLSLTVGNTTYEHTFSASDFANPGSATGYEVAASINANVLLGFEAVTLNNGSLVKVRPISENVNTMQISVPSNISAIDANFTLEFPSNKAETLRLYKNGILLTQDGSTASVYTNSQSSWSNTLVTGETLIISVDGTQAITYTFTDANFIVEGTYTSLSSSNSLESWVNVFNAQITGITASVVGSTIEFTSNLGSVSRASIVISGSSSLVSKAMFNLNKLSSTGVASDYILDRNTAQLQLINPLAKGDKLSAGTVVTQANIKSNSVVSGAVSLTQDANVWIAIDTDAATITTIQPGSLLSVSKPSSNIIRYTSSTSSVFSNVFVGDYLIVWSPELSVGNRLEGRIHAVSSNYIDLKITATEYTAAVIESSITYVQGFSIIRTDKVPQKFRVQLGTKTLEVVSAELQTQSKSVVFSVFNNTNIVITTNSDDVSGQIKIVDSNEAGIQIGFISGTTSVSQDPIIAYYDSKTSTSDLPLFFHSKTSADSYASPVDSYLTSFSSVGTLSGFDPNELITFLQPYNNNDEQPAGESVQMSDISGTAITLLPQYADLRRLRTDDRFFIANPLDFGYNDELVTIIDNNSVGETYTLPLYRRAITNSSYATNNYSFNAYDVDSGVTSPFSVNFAGFDFSNFKALMQAKKVIKQTPSQSALLFRSVRWGRSGEKVSIRYTYPTSANKTVDSQVVVGTSVDIKISLKSGTAITTAIDSTTQWNVTVTSNTPVAGVDQVKYTFSGTGTSPSLSLSGGEYVTILNTTGFNPRNIGTFKVSTVTGFTPTATSFSVQMPTGTALAQSNAVTIVNNGINFYNNSNTLASDINTYVNSNLKNYITSTIVNDGGMSGSGIISLSTYENSNFTVQSYFLKDGINWIASSNTTGSPQFTFKRPLTLATDVGYTFNTSDEVRLIPTTVEHVKALLSNLAVSGITTVGSVLTVDRGTKLQLATNTLGSNGAIQIVGGNANTYSFPVLTSGQLIDNSTMEVSANAIASQSVASDQWFRLQASNAQNKNTGIDVNTSVTIVKDSPLVGQSTVTLLNKEITQRYFGAPRTVSGLTGLTFKVEKQGSLVCFSYTGSTTSPQYLTYPVNFGSTTGDTFSVTLVPNTGDSQYTILSGTTSFSGLSIGDLVTINIPSSAVNSGTFFVSGVSSSVLQVTNFNAAALGSTSITAGTTFTATTGVMEGDMVTIGSPFSSTNRGNYRVIRTFNDSFWIENTNVVEEEKTLSSNSLVFHEYEATIPGDIFTVNGLALLASNAGSYPIVSVTSPTVAVVQGSISNQTATNLAGNQQSVYVLEGTKYSGYKQVSFVANQPGSNTFNNILLNTSAQYNKIGLSGGVSFTSLGKLNFSTTIRAGLDSYAYDTGIIGEANRVVYGDPRDALTYPGVSAAGTDIFIREPLLLKIKIALAIRTNIGVSFSQITQQIQSSVYALVKANKLGQALDLSSIVETVRQINGITSVVLTNPPYSTQNDLVVLQTGQKAFIASLSDISVTLLV